MRETLDVTRAAGLEAPVGSTITVVQGPLRTNVAEFHPSAILLSDQFLQLWPGKRFMQLHTAVVARASLDLQTYGRMVGRHDPSTDLWTHGMLTMALLDVWRVARTQGDEYVSDIFRKFTFVPAVEQFPGTRGRRPSPRPTSAAATTRCPCACTRCTSATSCRPAAACTRSSPTS